MKWEPVAAMVLLLGLGYWLAREPHIPGLRDGATTQKFQIGAEKGVLETVEGEGRTHTFRLVYRNGQASEVMDAAAFARMVTPGVAEELARARGNPIFRLLNITNWGSVAWIALGFAGQLAFSGRMLLQWFVSEKRKESVVTIGFWWMSLIGGAILFTYFVWRQDIVGVLGQSTGVIIYARNIRLHYKKQRREAKVIEKQRAKGLAADGSAGLAPEPKTGAAEGAVR